MRMMFLSVLVFVAACGGDAAESDSGVKKARVSVQTGADGLTTEQRNVKRRVEEDNRPGAIKHLYLVSAYSGDVILYSTVKGKVTSGGKRLSPYAVTEKNDTGWGGYKFNGQTTLEVLQDDGTYGSSCEYLYWWDQRDNYYQIYVSGGTIPIVSATPLRFPKVVVSVEADVEK
jgi:hypothetical protein